MPTAERLLQRKGGKLAALAPDATVLDASQLMNDRHIGSVLVLENGRVSGIFTERDVLRRIVAERRDPSATKLRDVMTKTVACAAPHTTLDELRTVMREKHIRHVPVVDVERPLGMISIGDLNNAEADVRERTIEYLELYISRP